MKRRQHYGPPVEDNDLKKTIGRMLTVVYPVDYHTRGMYAGTEYLIRRILFRTSYRQEDAAKEWQVSTVTVRHQAQRLQEQYPKQEQLRKLYVSNGGKGALP